MRSLLANVFFLVIWYGVLSLFLWTIIGSIRSGQAGASGMPLDREESPIRFWFRIAWSCIWWTLFAALPWLIVAKTGQLIKLD